MPAAHIRDVVRVVHRPLVSREPVAQQSKDGGKGPEVEDIVTGTVNKPLLPEGHKQAEKLAAAAKDVDKIDTTQMKRGTQTADTIADKADVKPKINPAFGPWKMGELQGKRQSEVKDIVDDYISKTPYKPIPGGESFNTFKDRILGEVLKQVAEWKPDQKRLNIVHSIGIHTIQAWVANGAPKDRSIDIQAMLDRGKTQAGCLYRLDPKTMHFTPIKSITKDGIYFARHGKTEWDDVAKG